jgi:hypothetical protein
LAKKDKNSNKIKGNVPDLRDGIHGEVTPGGLLREGNPSPLAFEDEEIIVAPGSKIPPGQTTRE